MATLGRPSSPPEFMHSTPSWDSAGTLKHAPGSLVQSPGRLRYGHDANKGRGTKVRRQKSARLLQIGPLPSFVTRIVSPSLPRPPP